MNNGCVLLFHVEKSKQKQIAELCRQLAFTPVIVPKRQYGESLGALARIDGISKTGKPYEGEELSREMMVFSGIGSEALDLFLAKYREKGIEPVDLKAVLTPNNIFWDVLTLFEELEKEHQAFHK